MTKYFKQVEGVKDKSDLLDIAPKYLNWQQPIISWDMKKKFDNSAPGDNM